MRKWRVFKFLVLLNENALKIKGESALIIFLMKFL